MSQQFGSEDPDANKLLMLIRNEQPVPAALLSEIRQRYASWDNDVWISFAVRVFHAEETGKPLNLPKL